MPDIFSPERTHAGFSSGPPSPTNSRLNQNMHNWRNVRLNRRFDNSIDASQILPQPRSKPNLDIYRHE